MAELFQVSYSRIKLWRKCQYAHYLKYVKKLRKKTKLIPFFVGDTVHKLLEAYWKKEDYQAVVDQMWLDQKKLLPAERDYYKPELEKAIFLTETYIQYYRKERIKVSFIEKEYSCELVPGKIKLVGKIDSLMKTLHGRWLLERKTAKKLTHKMDELDIDAQPYIYVHLMGEELDGVVWDFIRTELPKTKKPKPQELFARHFMPISENAVRYHLRNLSALALEVYNNQEARTPWLDKFNCPRCEFFRICRSEALGLDTEFIIRSEYEAKDVGKK